MRRDSERPVAAYAGLPGCGLGLRCVGLLDRRTTREGWSPRGDAARDPGFVTRGLLVRQNYTEADVGRPKAAALTERLSLLSDTCEVTGVVGHAQAGLDEDAQNCDFIFDTTINTAVQAALDEAQRQGTFRVPVVQAATDNQTATLGIVTVTSSASTTTTSELDQALRRKAASDLSLCSVPNVLGPRRPSTVYPRAGLLRSDLPRLRSGRDGNRSIRDQCGSLASIS